jgi:NAD(P)-dependent dehydrogenase (short-subunit alcohol dehydrogenase family)
MLRGMTTVVTGGAGALGSAVVRELVARGEKCAVLDTARGHASLEKLVKSAGEGARAYEGDLTDRAAWITLVPRIEADLGPITNAVLVAGAWQGGKPLHEDADDAVWTTMLTVNLETVHRSLRALVPGMVARKHGSIVVIGSRNVERPWTGASAAAYTAAKSAVVALAQAVAAEVLASGVRINAVLPSTLDTAANRAAMPGADPKLWVTTESAAKVIAFLLSEDARDISGAAIPVYGRS